MAMGAAGAFSTFGSFVDSIIDFSSFLDTSAYKKKQVKLQLAQLQDDMGATYRSNLDQLIELGGAYEDINLQIKQANANLGSANEWLDRYGDYYDYVMGQQQLGVDQSRGNLESLIYQGLNTYQQQNANWQNQLTRAAEIGQSGNTARLLAAAQRQNIINTFGEDMTVDAEGGTFGRQMQMQNDAVNLARQGMEQTRLDIEADRQSVLNSMDVINESLVALNSAKDSYYNSFRDSIGSIIRQGHMAGETYDDLGQAIEMYRQYFAASDADYDRMKTELLEQYKPLDFEIRKRTAEWETGGESQHGANYWSEDYYQIYDKATGKLATQDQVEKLLMNYAGSLSEKDWYSKGKMVGFGGGRVSNSYGLSDKAIEAIIKNSNYNKRKDYK